MQGPIMSPSRSFLRLVLLLALLLLAACGNKGPLVKSGAPATPAPTH
jgi:predicted small lipoprotein YifL